MKLEVLDQNSTYHIYNRGINGCTIFASDENKSYFLKLVEKYLENVASIHAYCLMDNHFHFLMTINVSSDIATQAFSNLFNSYAKAFNKSTGRTGSLFEKHFKRISIDNEDYFKSLVVYIHTNPQHHFNEDFTDFRFSSYKAYLSTNHSKLDKSESLRLFGDIENFFFAHNQKMELIEALMLE
ncbi:transposase [Flavobacterium sp. J372]|uniref:transposase n=1 Tax=Flavobacterium sp. J372 TaxID=2898436 RepID=UPI002151151A|nr:transposase [Flavobacterium sp. J372]MCR5860963.1 transposase [Flavobacterium sp. J372]